MLQTTQEIQSKSALVTLVIDIFGCYVHLEGYT